MAPEQGAGRTAPPPLILGWARNYQRAWLRADVIAGVSLWAIAIPIAIAYARVGSLPPHIALYAVIGGAFAYALLGTSRQLAVAPTSSGSLLTASLAIGLAAAGSAKFIALAAAVAIVGGLLLLLFGWLRLGFVSQLVAPAVQTGFLAGLGLVVIFLQIAAILDLDTGAGKIWRQAATLAANLAATNRLNLALGLGCVLALILLARFVPAAPGPLIVIVAGIVLSRVFDLAGRGIPVVGDVGGGLPVPALPLGLIVDDWLALVPGALAIALIGYSESIAVASDFAEQHDYEIDPDRELLALGAANLVAGLLQGYSVTGVISLSGVNNRAGARTPLALLVLVAMTIVTVLVLLPLFAPLPVVVLAAIILRAMTPLIDPRKFAALRQFSNRDFLIALVAMFGVLVLGVLPGLLAGVALSLLLLVAHDSRPPISVLGQLPESPVWVETRANPTAVTDPRVLVFRLDASLRFVNTEWMRQRLQEMMSAGGPELRWVLIDLSYSYELDGRAVDTLKRIHQGVLDSHRQLALVNVHPMAWTMLEKSGELAHIGAANVFRPKDDGIRVIVGRLDGGGETTAPPKGPAA